MRRPSCLIRPGSILLGLTPLVAAVWSAASVDATPAHAEARWQWPVQPPAQVVRGFAPPAHDWLPGHRGVDLAGRVGDPVLAAGDGIVTVAGSIGAMTVVAIRHPDGLETTYEPVRPVVRVGAHVTAGTVIGLLVRAGSHCAPRACLHWGLRRAGSYLDPLALVGRARVRLLPMLSDAGHASWLAPAVSGASVGSSAVAVGWAGLVLRRRRRRLPPGVVSLANVRRERERRVVSVTEGYSPPSG